MRIVFLILSILLPHGVSAESIKVGVWNANFWQKGPGLLIADILDKRPEYYSAIASKIKTLQLDYLLLTDVDQDDELWAANLLAQSFGFEHIAIGSTNRGLDTGFDLDQNHSIEADDRQGFGDFRGQHSMVLLSREAPAGLTSFNELKLADFAENPDSYYQEEAWQVLRLSPTGIWMHDFGAFDILSAYANTPAFDGPERRNQIRNAAEVRFWQRFVEGEAFGTDEGEMLSLSRPFILLGTLNLDPANGKGENQAIVELLASPALSPVTPKGAMGDATADWRELGIGAMRVDYILPSCHFREIQSGQVDLESESSHRLIWAELELLDNCNSRQTPLRQ